MAVAKSNQTRSTGDMLTALNQVGQSKRSRRARQLSGSQFCVENDHLVERFNQFSDGDEQNQEHNHKDEGYELKKLDDKWDNRVPLLERADDGERFEPRWKSCRWLDEQQDQHVDEQQNVCRATSKKSLLESLFSISSNHDVGGPKDCSDAKAPPTWLSCGNSSERRRISECDGAQFNESRESELLLIAKDDAGKGDSKKREEAAATRGDVERRVKLDSRPHQRASLSSNATLTGDDNNKLSGLPQQGKFPLKQKLAQRQVITNCRRQSETTPLGFKHKNDANDQRDRKQTELLASDSAQTAIELAYLSEPIEQLNGTTSTKRTMLDEEFAGNGLARKRQQVSEARDLASSSPILSLVTTNSNYDATGDRSNGRANKEFCDDATATCNSSSSSSKRNSNKAPSGRVANGPPPPPSPSERLHSVVELASCRISSRPCCKRRQESVLKLPRDERRRRTSRQLEKVAATKLERRRRATTERDLFLSFGESSWPAESKSQSNLTDHYNGPGKLQQCCSNRTANDSLGSFERQKLDGLRNNSQAGREVDDDDNSTKPVVWDIAHGLESNCSVQSHENCAIEVGQFGACAKDNADQFLSSAVASASPFEQGPNVTTPNHCDGQRAIADDHQPARRTASSAAVGQLPSSSSSSSPPPPTGRRHQVDENKLACQGDRENLEVKLSLATGRQTTVTNEIVVKHSSLRPPIGSELGNSMTTNERAGGREREAPLVQMSDRNQQQEQCQQRPMAQSEPGERRDNLAATSQRRVAEANTSAAGSWRRQLITCPALVSQLGVVGNSGSYKVAQHQQQQCKQLPNRNRSSQTDQQTLGGNSIGASQYCTFNINGQEVEARDNSGRTQALEQQHEPTRSQTGSSTNANNNNNNSQRRLSRPGRSPISLQRQTNARLARHRLKIKQQRQEQLASLALREREQLRTRQGHRQHLAGSGSRLVYGNNDNEHQRIDVEILPREQANQQTANRSGGFLNNILQRLSGRRVPPNSIQLHQHQWRQRASESNDLAEVALVSFDHQQQQVRQSRAPSRIRLEQDQTNRIVAIDICDNRDEQQLTRDTRSEFQPSQMTIIDCEQLNAAIHRGRQPANARSANLHQQHHISSVGAHSNHSTGGQTHRQANTSAQMAASKRNSADSALGTSTGSSSSSSSSSTSSSVLSLNKPFCKICHLSSNRNGSDKLISPCKCSGTMQHVHCGCLLKWLEISNRTNEKPISCELCSHEYTWHKRFNYKQMRLPKCSTKDVLLHIIFVLALGGMLFCAVAPLFYGGGGEKSSPAAANAMMMLAEHQAQDLPRSREIPFGPDQHNYSPGHTNKLQVRNGNGFNAKPSTFRSTHQTVGAATFPASPSQSLSTTPNGRLANDEKFILACAAFFFISFFIAIYAQTKTRDTLYGLVVKFTNMNLTYFITEYDHGYSNTSSIVTTSQGSTAAIDSDCNNINDHSNRLSQSNHSQGSVVEHTLTSTSQNSNNEGQYNHKSRNNKHLHG